MYTNMYTKAPRYIGERCHAPTLR